MAPKRRAVATNGPVSASQPTPQRPNIRAAGRKRTMSDADLSDVESVVSNTSSKVSKVIANKRKRVTVEVEREAIMEEEEEQISEGEAAPACDRSGQLQDDAMATQDEDEIELSQPSKRQKMTVKRRTLSPAKKSKTVRTSRTSLLAGLADGAENTQTVGEFTFSPLATVVERRMQERHLSSPNGRIDDEDEPMSERYVLDTHDEIVYPQAAVSLEPVTAGATPAKEKANSKRSTNGFEDERKELQDAVVTFQREAAVAAGKLQVLQVEVKALGFGDDALTGEESDDKAAQVVLRSVRESMEDARAFLDQELPGAHPDDATNQDIVQVLVANVREFVNRLRVAGNEAQQNAALTTDLARQIDGILTTVADEKLKFGQLKKDNNLQVERLTTSLNQYIEEEKKLQTLVTQLEGASKEATELAASRLDHIGSLQDQVKTAEKQRDHFEERLDATDQDLNDETAAKDQAEADLVAKDVELEEMQGRMDGLEEDIEEQEAEIESLRTLKDTEQLQRIAAEADLDQASQRIEELDAKVQASGVEANELRVKIYELQNKITKLENEATECENQHKHDLSAEGGRRKQASELAEQREATIVDFQRELEDTKEYLREVEADKDEQIADLKDMLDQKDVETQSMAEAHNAESTEKDNNIAELRKSIEDFENSLHNSQQESSEYKITLRDREATIAELEGSVTVLEAEKRSLEDRVSKEAMDMLEIQNDLNEQIGVLKADIEEREEKLKVVHKKRLEEETTMHELQEARDAEMIELKAQYATELNLRHDEFEALKRQFADFVRQTREGLERRQEERRQAHAREEADDEALQNALQQQLAALNAPTPPPTTIAVQHKGMVNGVKKPQRKSKRLVDSGIGLEDSEVAMMEEMVGA